MTGALPFSEWNERLPFIAIQRVERAIAIHCHSATSGSDCHFAALTCPYRNNKVCPTEVGAHFAFSITEAATSQ
ncbi:MAG: hypothetical protein IIV24_04830 [Alistipes sp.]|nr:hypothetical protein [Alistipes sp.]